jgi:hypothetical protein
LNSMLEAKTGKITVGKELAEVLKRDEMMFGTGPEGALKAIQVSQVGGLMVKLNG